MRRFISTDPLGIDAFVNLYAYGDMNPLFFVDPFGLCANQPWYQNVLSGISFVGKVAWGATTFVIQLAIGENYGQAWRDMFTSAWEGGVTGGILPENLNEGVAQTQQKAWYLGSDPSENGMHAWHAGSNAFLAHALGLIGAPFIFFGGIYHETPLD